MGLEKRVISGRHRWVFLIMMSIFFVAGAFFAYGQIADSTMGYCAHSFTGLPACSDTKNSFVDCCPDPNDVPDLYGAGSPFSSRENCMDNYFSTDGESAAYQNNCRIGYCYYGKERQKCESAFYSECMAEEGTFADADSYPAAQQLISGCTLGCCCYQETDGITNHSIISTGTFCNEQPAGLGPFFDTSLLEQECPGECNVVLASAIPGEGNEDGLVGLADCNNSIDDDGDGKVDMDDVCCFTPNTNNGERCAEKLPDCSSGSRLAANCNCFGGICAKDQYCCEDSGCIDYECGTRCIHDMPCSSVDAGGCSLFKRCNADGTLASECAPRESCNFNTEICSTPADDNDDGFTNCGDVFCDGQVCAESEAEKDNCKDRGTLRAVYDSVNEVYRCCYSGDIKDCDEDGIFETCGQCDCLKLMDINPPKPVLEAPRVQRGVQEIYLDWTLRCPVERFILKKCRSDLNPECSSARPEQLDQQQPLASPTQKSFIEKSVKPNTIYCYQVVAMFAGGKSTSSEIRCIRSGDLPCMQVPYDNFCVDETYQDGNAFDETLVLRATCDGNNTLDILENCNQRGPGYLCKGPFGGRYGITECIQTDDCDACGGKFNVFATFGSITQDASGTQSLCSESKTCYYDSSNTSIDYYHSCLDVQGCFDYLSEGACDDNAGENNNKCLSRDCEWMPFNEEFGQGVCMDQEYYSECSICNEVEKNSIFGVCTEEKCQMFGDCFLRQSDGMCVEKKLISCNDYSTNQDCTGDRPVVIDVRYDGNGNRISGTNRITSESLDLLGFGLCSWDKSKYPNSPCFKDADGDGLRDLGGMYAYDVTPPTTTILTPKKAKTLNISFMVSDYDESGAPGSGVSPGHSYFCLARKGNTCYPNEPARNMQGNKGWIEFGGGAGEYDLFFYSADNANNLEVVEKYSIEIDRTGPKIDIAYKGYQDHDLLPDGALMFEVKVDESAYCSDSFYDGDAEPRHMITDRLGDHHILHYKNLKDGYYNFLVVCRDLAGNEAEKKITARLDIDSFIYHTAPSGPIDYAPIDLIIETEDSAASPRCRWSPFEAGFGEMTYSFDCEKQTLLGASFYRCRSNGNFIPPDDVSKTYSIDVKCEYGNGLISDDQIQFTYDIAPPRTKANDADDNEIDLSRWFTGQALEGKIYLKCEDFPSFGFGCNKTLYCIDDTQFCTPSILATRENPIEFDLTQNRQLKLCYMSKEEAIKGMGGLWETRKCHNIQVDTQPPWIRLEGEIAAAISEQSPFYLTENSLRIKGQVRDPDVTQGSPENKLDITVYHIDGGGESRYENISANPSFNEVVELKQGLNKLEFIAVDRSGQYSGPPYDIYYVFVADFSGERIFLIDPPFGMAASQKFEAKFGTYKRGECRYSLIDDFNSAKVMTSSAEGAQHSLWVDLDALDVPATITAPVSVWCNFDNAVVWHKKEALFSWDSSKPVIEDIYINRSRIKDENLIVEYPLETGLIVVSDDEVRCKYTQDQTMGFENPLMPRFPGYDDALFNLTNKIMLFELEDETEYTYYVQCQNMALLKSDRKKLDFKVDTTLDGGIRLVAPKDGKTANQSFDIKIFTTKSSSWCELSMLDEDYARMDKLSDYEFEKKISLNEGKYLVRFRCLTSTDLARDKFQIIVDTSGPSRPEVKDSGKCTAIDDKLSASWDSKDNMTDVTLYSYSITSILGTPNVLNWTNTTRKKADVSGLNLTLGKTYFWMVRSMNELGLWSETGLSDGIVFSPECVLNASNSTIPIDYCADGILNNNETGIDCGGVNCDACPSNFSCRMNSDCLSANCVQGRCVRGTCSDGIRNQDEPDIDCGGICSPCGLNFTCNTNADCTSNYCSLKRCTEPSCSDNIKNGDEEGIDCGGSCPTRCPLIEQPEPQTCTIEQPPEHAGKSDSDCDGMADEWENLYGLNPGIDDSDDDPDGDGWSNLEEFLYGGDPFTADSSTKDKGGLGLLWLGMFIVLIIIVLTYGSYYMYEVNYDKIPPKYRKTIDSVVDPVQNFFSNTYDKASSFLRRLIEKTPLGKYLPDDTPQKHFTQEASPKNPIELSGQREKDYKGAYGDDHKKEYMDGLKGSQAKGPGVLDLGTLSPGSARPQKVKVHIPDEYKHASAKEAIELIRKKRQEQKTKERQNLVSGFEEEKMKEKLSENIENSKRSYDKKKELLDKVEGAFSASDKKEAAEKKKKTGDDDS